MAEADLEKGFDGAFHCDAPLVGKGIIIGVGESSVFDEIFEVTIRSTAPSLLHDDLSPAWIAKLKAAYDVFICKLARTWVETLSGKACGQMSPMIMACSK